MKRLENTMKDLQGDARNLYEKINDARSAIFKIQADLENRGGISPEDEAKFTDALNAIFSLAVDIDVFIASV